MEKCNQCLGASNFHYGVRGKNADRSKILFVLNKPDSRTHSLFGYEAALQETKTGQQLAEILKYNGITFEDIYLTNFYKCSLSHDREPSKKEYKKCLKIFKEQIKEFKPEKIVLFGRNPYMHLFPESSKKENLEKKAGKILHLKRIPVMISLHPSTIWALRAPEKQEIHYRKIQDFLTRQ
ncbi:MAG TPA: hypothetical protein ENG87_03540 [Candidatus Pacearchaeota archaeon]|nr:uracil DNA glycosylase superfamily protein [archaeon BMS3Abin17]HDK42427.1 hypothetical protein [Candidatus Pacearchaeota archaeon]HDZ60542.1 hypothetical protein [Candidatus Pacearchaeota archaeon]